MISENSKILGDFYGGGDLYLQNNVCLNILGNMYDSETSTTQTTLTLNPELLREEQYYILQGDSFSPYVRVAGNDYSSGFGIISGNKRKYVIYSLNQDDHRAGKYNSTSTAFAPTGESDSEGDIYKNSADLNDTRNYYWDENIEKYYLLTDDLQLKQIDFGRSATEGETSTTPSSIDSIYYIETTIIISSYVSIENNTIADKLYKSPYTNFNMVHLLKDGSFTADIDTIYTLIKDVNTKEYINPDKFQNVTRCIYLENDGTVYSFPVNTTIIMFVNNRYYTYTITEDNTTKIYLKDFVYIGQNADYNDEDDEKTYIEGVSKFQEVSNLKDLLRESDPNVPALWETSECFRFIVDFSECNTYLNDMSYDLTYEANEIVTPDGIPENSYEEEIYAKTNSNSFNIEHRQITNKLNPNKSSYTVGETVQILGTLELGKLSDENTSDTGKDMVAVINLKDSNNNYIPFPDGSIININSTEYSANRDIQFKVFENLLPKGYKKQINLSVNTSNVDPSLLLEKGIYKIEFKLYYSEDDVIQGNHPMEITNVQFSIAQNTNYGIKIVGVSKKDDERFDESQLITDRENTTKTVHLEYKNGSLEDGAYILVKAYKRENEGEFAYSTFGTPITEEQIINVNVDDNLIDGIEQITSNLIFDSSLENGTYRIVYELVDKNNILVTSTYINFIVHR